MFKSFCVTLIFVNFGIISSSVDIVIVSSISTFLNFIPSPALNVTLLESTSKIWLGTPEIVILLGKTILDSIKLFPERIGSCITVSE